LPIGEIGERVGYKTDKYFIKVFKTYEGVSPSRYRNGNTTNGNKIQ
jgi:YesN/AraC family two-component response regulator